MRKLSKYERAWRERAGHFTRSPGAEVVPVPASTVTEPTDAELERLTAPTVVDPMVATLAAVDPAPRVTEPGLISLRFTSSNVASAELDTTTGLVAVTFSSGAQYRYGGFTSALMTAWRDAKSAGGWFHANVRSKPDAHPSFAVPAVRAPVEASADGSE